MLSLFFQKVKQTQTVTLFVSPRISCKIIHKFDVNNKIKKNICFIHEIVVPSILTVAVHQKKTL